MPLIQAVVASLLLLACVGLVADQPSVSALLRGSLSNLVLFWLLVGLTGRLTARWLR